MVLVQFLKHHEVGGNGRGPATCLGHDYEYIMRKKKEIHVCVGEREREEERGKRLLEDENSVLYFVNK